MDIKAYLIPEVLERRMPLPGHLAARGPFSVVAQSITGQVDHDKDLLAGLRVEYVDEELLQVEAFEGQLGPRLLGGSSCLRGCGLGLRRGR
jgi:hypothetical protein